MSHPSRPAWAGPAGLALLLAAATPARASDTAALVARGDEAYARRAEGEKDGVCAPAEVDTARDLYRQALQADPDSALARGRYLKAIFFRATFCGMPDPQRLLTYEEAKRVADDGVARLEKAAGPLKEAGQRWRGRPGAAELLYWSAVDWGEWALVKGKMAAARSGAAGRIRDLAAAALALDPDLEKGGPERVLGRLHDQSPRIIFFTMWVSRTEAIEALRRSLAKGPEEVVTRCFLGEALLDHGGEKGRAEAITLLRQAAEATPRPDNLLEDAHYTGVARALLKENGVNLLAAAGAGVR